MTAITTPIPVAPPGAGTARPAAGSDWIWMAAAFALTGLGQLATQILVARVLGPSEYSEVAALLNVMNLVGIPLVAVQLTVTRVVARGGSPIPLLRRSLVLGLVGAAVAIATAPWWGSALAVTSVAACRVTSLFLPATIAVAVARGTAVGRTRSRALAAAMALTTVFRLVVGVAAAHRFGTAGVLTAAVAAEASLAVVLAVTVRAPRRSTAPPTPAAIDAGRAVGAAAAAQVAMWLVVNVDLLWARRLLDSHDAGRYLAVGSVAVGLVSFGQAYLWHHAATATDPAAGATIVRRSALVVLVASLVGVPAAAVALPVLLGPRFDDLTPMLVAAGIWAVLASVVQTATATRLIAGQRLLRHLAPVAAVAVLGPPCWVAVLGHRPLVLSTAAVCNAALGAVVLGVGMARSAAGSREVGA